MKRDNAAEWSAEMHMKEPMPQAHQNSKSNANLKMKRMYMRRLEWEKKKLPTTYRSKVVSRGKLEPVVAEKIESLTRQYKNMITATQHAIPKSPTKNHMEPSPFGDWNSFPIEG